LEGHLELVCFKIRAVQLWCFSSPCLGCVFDVCLSLALGGIRGVRF